ncbi:hypothetical protein Misp01_33560 [Microtetraspora sp. NBRC 13810]|uniref:LuxR C-terminal-related transcriptional regulator n=1 Tax=Microtetraspora sp. NBRC 13810 TaxID=3030990 RepID=UPI0024A18D9A|nr:LuxR C-terminal-related transcriptional regulator [Microtetraspora sp. NBRC 13810]GLW08226.1 hypothetical protein Misp01_33560 [Microtetraspora sp. NBRC 13810]
MATLWPFVGREEDRERIAGIIGSGRRGGVMVAGPAGIGKSRLAAEAVAGLSPRRFHVVTVRATRAASAIPYGALAHLLPADLPPTGNPLRRAADAVAARAGGLRPVLDVDDAHLLDPSSAAVVHNLLFRSRAVLVATVRTPGPVPDPVTALWKEGLVTRLDLAPLPPERAHELLADVLGGPVEPETAARLWRAADGSMLFLRELVLAGLRQGAFRPERSGWRLRGGLPMSPRLAELIGLRLGGLGEATARVLELTAFGEPLGLAVLLRLCPREAVEEAETRRLIRVRGEPGDQRATLAHPLYGEAVRTGCPATRAARRHRELAEATAPTTPTTATSAGAGGAGTGAAGTGAGTCSTAAGTGTGTTSAGSEPRVVGTGPGSGTAGTGTWAADAGTGTGTAGVGSGSCAAGAGAGTGVADSAGAGGVGAGGAGAGPLVGPYRLVLWRLEGGIAQEPATLLEAARLAWAAHDHAVAERLGRAAVATGGGPAAGLLLAAMLGYAGEPQEAESVLASIARPPRDDAGRALLAISRAHNLDWGLGHHDEAIRLAEETLTTLHDPAARQEILAYRASQSFWTTGPAQASTLATEALTPTTPPPTLDTPRTRTKPQTGTPPTPTKPLTEASPTSGPSAEPSSTRREPLTEAPPGEHRTGRAPALAASLMEASSAPASAPGPAGARSEVPAAPPRVAADGTPVPSGWAGSPRGPVPGGVSGRGVARARAVRVLADGHAGRCAAAVEIGFPLLAEGSSWGEEIQDVQPAIMPAIRLGTTFACVFAGDLGRAGRAAAARVRAAVEEPLWHLDEMASCALAALVARLSGRVGEAVRRGREAAGHARGEAAALGPPAYGELAHAQVLAGDLEGARRSLDHAALLTLPGTTVLACWAGLARPWLAAACGDTPRAMELSRASCSEARRLGLLGLEMLALHDAVRLGAGSWAAERLAEIAKAHDGRLAPVCAAHARAAVQRSGRDLEAVSRDLEALGQPLAAADAAAQAARAYLGAGRATAARTASARAWALSERADGARTPALADLRAPGLTRREREISQLAVEMTSAAIARRLSLSVRTVDNHLSNIFTKLGIGSRAELARVLGTGPHTPPANGTPPWPRQP